MTISSLVLAGVLSAASPMAVRGAVGLGVTDKLLGGRLAVEGEVWLHDHVALGVNGVASGSVGLGSRGVIGLAPDLVLGVGPRDSHFIVRGGFGPAAYRAEELNFCFSGPCGAPDRTRGIALLGTAALGWLGTTDDLSVSVMLLGERYFMQEGGAVLLSAGFGFPYG